MEAGKVILLMSACLFVLGECDQDFNNYYYDTPVYETNTVAARQREEITTTEGQVETPTTGIYNESCARVITRDCPLFDENDEEYYDDVIRNTDDVSADVRAGYCCEVIYRKSACSNICEDDTPDWTCCPVGFCCKELVSDPPDDDPTAAIVGAVIAVLIGCACCGCCVYAIWRSQRAQSPAVVVGNSAVPPVYPQAVYGQQLDQKGPQSYQYGPQSGQYGPQSGQYGPQSGQYGPQSGQYGPQSGQYGPQPDQYGPQSDQYGQPSGQYGPQPDQYGQPSGQYGPQSDQYGPQPDQYGPPSGQYGPPGQSPSQIGQPPGQYGLLPYQYGQPPGQYGPSAPPDYKPPKKS